MATKLRPYNENELLDKLKQYCPDFKVGLNDIRNPTQDFVKEMYRRILIEFNVDISSLVQVKFRINNSVRFQFIIHYVDLTNGMIIHRMCFQWLQNCVMFQYIIFQNIYSFVQRDIGE